MKFLSQGCPVPVNLPYGHAQTTFVMSGQMLDKKNVEYVR